MQTTIAHLIEDGIGDGSSTVVSPRGGIAKLFVQKTGAGACSVVLEASPDGGTTWFSDESTTFTSSGYTAVQTKLGIQYRVTLSGTTGSVEVNAWLAYESHDNTQL